MKILMPVGMGFAGGTWPIPSKGTTFCIGWLRVSVFVVRNLLGVMNVLILEGRSAQPKRLVNSGYQFQFPAVREAFLDLYRK
jgi:NAD dependent epimerase/dehydratase family enzyme